MAKLDAALDGNFEQDGKGPRNYHPPASSPKRRFYENGQELSPEREPRSGRAFYQQGEPSGFKNRPAATTSYLNPTEGNRDSPARALEPTAKFAEPVQMGTRYAADSGESTMAAVN